MDEVWLPFVLPLMKERREYPLISSHGRYRSSPSSRFVSNGHVRSHDTRCYIRPVGMSQETTKARVMCYAFYPSTWMMDALGIKWEADHINNDKTNDIILNLQPLTVKDNRVKAFTMKRKSSSRKRKRMIEQIDCATDETICVWLSQTDVCNELGYGRRNLWLVCNGRQTSSMFSSILILNYVKHG